MLTASPPLALFGKHPKSYISPHKGAIGEKYMFKKLTQKEQIRKERAKNAELMVKNQTLEEAVLELASIVSESMEAQNGETVPTEDNE
jgi:hypothetical protein